MTRSEMREEVIPLSTTIDEVADIIGVSAPVIRMWEIRYGWPRPLRDKNGWRMYHRSMVEQLQRFVSLLKDGHQHRDLIVDGWPVWPANPRTSIKPPRFIFSDLPVPNDARAAALRAQVQRALLDRQPGPIIHGIDLAATIHPIHRHLAVYLPICLALAEHARALTPFPDAGRVRCAVARQLRGDEWLAINDEVHGILHQRACPWKKRETDEEDEESA